MNWVLVVAGLLPLWAAIFIVFTNMRTLRDDQPIVEPAPVQVEQPLKLEAEDVIFDEPDEPKSFFKGILERFKRGKEEKREVEIDFSEPKALEETVSSGLPKGLKRLWGVTFILIFLACLAFGLDTVTAYIFKEYRWVIGTTNPWTSQLELASFSTTAVAGFATTVSTLKTGIYLLKK